jgi:hypothetical protein
MIVCSDLHLQVTPPRCRTENEEEWLKYQYNMLMFIVGQANKVSDDVYIAGDITDKAVTSPRITTLFLRAMRQLTGTCYIMPGNHCLPNHSMAEIDKASYGILNELAQGTGNIKTIDQSPYAYVPYGEVGWKGNYDPSILFIHRLAFASTAEKPPFSTEAITSRELLELYPKPRILVTGDNHTKFITQMDGRTHINCGCTTKRTIDFQDKELAIYRINSTTFSVQVIPIPDDSVLVRDAHTEAQKESENKFKELVEMLKDTGTMTLDYVGNLRAGMHVLSKDAQKRLEALLG